jgi:hypothetical protein
MAVVAIPGRYAGCDIVMSMNRDSPQSIVVRGARIPHMDRIPVACTLEAGAARQRAADWGKLGSSVVGVERSNREMTVRFSDAAANELNRLVAAERECCGFANWQLTTAGEEIVLTITGDEFGVASLAESFFLWGLAR